VEIRHKGSTITVAAVTVALLGMLLLVGSMAASAPAQTASSTSTRGACHTASQSVIKRKNISCKSAIKVANKVAKAAYKAGKSLPDCKGDGSKRVSGWKVSAKPSGSGSFQAVGTKFSKGSKSFVASGGGSC